MFKYKLLLCSYGSCTILEVYDNLSFTVDGEIVWYVEDLVACVDAVVRRQSIRKHGKDEPHDPWNGAWYPGTNVYYKFKEVILQDYTCTNYITIINDTA